MDNEKSRFRHESLQDGDSIKELLQAITEGIGKGQLSFSDDNDEILLLPKGLLHFKLRASKEGGTNNVRFSLQWRDDTDTAPPRKMLKVNKKKSSRVKKEKTA